MVLYETAGGACVVKPIDGPADGVVEGGGGRVAITGLLVLASIGCSGARGAWVVGDGSVGSTGAV